MIFTSNHRIPVFTTLLVNRKESVLFGARTDQEALMTTKLERKAEKGSEKGCKFSTQTFEAFRII